MKIWGWERWLLETNGHMFFKLNSNISLNQTVPGKCFDLRVFNAEGKILKALQPADQPSSVVESHDHLREYRLPIILYTVLTVLLCLSCFCLLRDWIHVPHIIHCNGVCARCAKYSLSNTFCKLCTSGLSSGTSLEWSLGLWSTCSSFPGTTKSAYRHFNFFPQSAYDISSSNNC